MSHNAFFKNFILKPMGVFVFTALILQSCSPPEPVRIGIVTGTAGHMADMGLAARYAIQLAVDQCNEKGGIRGRRVEVIVKDGQQNANDTVKDVKQLIAQKVDVIIGPMSSTMAMAMLPYVNESRMVTVSPTATTPLLSGRNDYFFRVCPPAGDAARMNAEYQIRSGNMRRIAVAFHGRNPSYCEPFIKDFEKAFNAGGGKVITSIEFTANDKRPFFQIANELLSQDPDGILIIANAMDSAMLCQQIRKINPLVNISLSTWGGTHRFIELGGQTVEGVSLAMDIDWDSPNPRYQNFRRTFRDTYQHEPGIISLYSYNAAQAVLTALNIQKPGQSLKAALLCLGEFDSLQGKTRFDAWGDVKKPAFIRVIRNGKFTEPE